MKYEKVKCHECNGTGLSFCNHTKDDDYFGFGVITTDGYVKYDCKNCNGKGYFVVKCAGTGN